MRNSAASSSGNFPSRGLLVLLLALAFTGLLDASYLAASHYAGSGVACSVLKGCDAVLQSPYATAGGIPLAALGAVHYSLLFLLLAWTLFSGKKAALRTAAGLAGAGVLASMVFVYLQAFVIGAFCPYCLASAGISFAIGGVLAWIIYADYQSVRRAGGV